MDNFQKTIKCEKAISGHKGAINYLIQLSNGNLASCSDDLTIKIWDIHTFSLIKTLEDHFSRVTCLTQLKDGRLVSGSFDTSIRLWDLVQYKCNLLLCEHDSWVLDLLILKDRRLVSCSGDKTIRIWNVQKGRTQITLKGHNGWVTSITQIKNGNLLSCSEDKTIKFWDVIKGECVNSIAFEESVFSICELNEKILCGMEGKIIVCDSNEVIEEDFSFCSKICKVSNELICYGNEEGLLRLKDIVNGGKINFQNGDDNINSIILMHDGRIATCSNDSLITIWSIS